MDNKTDNTGFHNSSCSFDIWKKRFGAYFLNNGNVLFKLLTFPDTDNVILELKPYKKNKLKFNMNKISECVWEAEIEKNIINHGDRYRFIIVRNGDAMQVKDPCSMWQDTLSQWSRIYNHSLFKWSDKDWLCGKIKKRASRTANDTNGLLSVNSLRIYELHIGTFTSEGTFLSAKEKIKKLADFYKFNAIEIMPVENTYSFNWGYDGADKYAPNHTYGTPDEFKDLINYAHNCGLNVIMDMVPNHLGPDIAQLQSTGPYIEGENCFGYKFNYEKDKYSRYIRDFIIGAALNWLINYHCDGLRADMTKFMCSDYTMKQLAAEVNYHVPNAFLIAEDGRDNDIRVTKPFSLIEIDENEINHEKFISEINQNKVSLSALGFDTEWDFLFHKQMIASVLGVWDCRKKNLCDFDYSLRDAQTRVKYPMSHDEIGNIDGTRLISKILVKELNIESRVCDCRHSEKCKIAAHASHRVLVSLLDGSLENMSDIEFQNFLKENNIIKGMTTADIKNAYIRAVKKHKTVIGKIYSIPGPKMIFQGDEYADISYFKFFRKFSIGFEYYLREKGYEPGISAFMDSKLGSAAVCKKYEYINRGVAQFVADLNNLACRNIALNDGHIEKTVIHEQTDIHAIHTRKIYNEIFAVSNFSDKSYNSYGIMFPKGEWREIINSNSKKYAGDDNYANKDKIFSNYSYFSIPDNSIIFFEKL